MQGVNSILAATDPFRAESRKDVSAPDKPGNDGESVSSPDMQTTGFGFMNNLYLSTAVPQLSVDTLRSDETADVVIVGGGYTGLSTALHLAKHGFRPAVIEAGEIGHGCSGRNGGQVNPGLKLLPDEIEETYGAEAGKRLVNLSDGAPAEVFRLIEEHDIDCAAARTGTIRAAIDDAGLKYVGDFAEQSIRRTGPVRLLNEAEMRELTGTGIYRGGSFDPRGGHINPLAYARGIAQAAQRAGARLYANSAATKISKQGKAWKVETKTGSVWAAELVVATNGYTGDLWPGLRQTIAPIYTYLVATEPLPENIRKSIMPCQAALYEIAWDVVYFRLDEAGRLIFGGRGAQRDAASAKDYLHLIQYAIKLWPQLRDVAWPWHWYGQVAITHDHLPHLTAPEDGVHLMVGYNGRGIAMATVAGQQIASRIVSNRSAPTDLPIREALKPFPFHRFWRLGANITMAGHLLADRMRGR